MWGGSIVNNNCTVFRQYNFSITEEAQSNIKLDYFNTGITGSNFAWDIVVHMFLCYPLLAEGQAMSQAVSH
jgi:hypothetical protein